MFMKYNVVVSFAGAMSCSQVRFLQHRKIRSVLYGYPQGTLRRQDRMLLNRVQPHMVIIWTVDRLLQVVTIDIHFGEVKISWLDVVLNAEGMPRLELRPNE